MSNYKTIFMLTWKTCGELKKKEKKTPTTIFYKSVPKIRVFSSSEDFYHKPGSPNDFQKALTSSAWVWKK